MLALPFGCRHVDVVTSAQPCFCHFIMRRYQLIFISREMPSLSSFAIALRHTPSPRAGMKIDAGLLLFARLRHYARQDAATVCQPHHAIAAASVFFFLLRFADFFRTTPRWRYMITLRRYARRYAARRRH